MTTDSDSVTLPALERDLKKCADIIRNVVDKTDYKDYILPLVFYKAVNDTYQDEKEEKARELVEKNADLDIEQARELAAQKKAYFDLYIEEEYTWDKLLEADNIAEKIDEAFNEFSTDNASLNVDNVCTVTYQDVDAFLSPNGNKLRELVNHLRDINLSRERLPPDMLGEAYMDLVKHFASEEGRDGGEYFTPPQITNLVVRLLEPFESGVSVHDPTCGSAGMLVEIARHLRHEQEVEEEYVRSLRFTGQELNTAIHSIAQMNLALNGLEGKIKQGDSLSDPQFKDGEELERFDYVLANFPFSANWDKERRGYGRYNWHDKLPRADRGDYAFIMHMAAQLSDIGKAAIVIPHGVLFRKHEQRYRKPMLENDLVEAIIGLPANLFQNNSIPSAVLVLNKQKSADRKNEVQFIHAADEAFYQDLSNQSELTEEGLDHIIDNFKNWTTENRVSRTVSIDEIRENEYNLNIALYVDTTEPEKDINVTEELAMLRELESKRDEIESTMSNHMEALNYE